MKSRKKVCLRPGVCAAFLFLGLVSSTQARRGVEPVFAKSAFDSALCARLAALAPSVDPEEARRVAYTAYHTGLELARERDVVWPPGFQNFLVHSGARKGGLCFQWATELLVRLDALKLQTLEFHWAESFPGSVSEHNVIVITARGQPFVHGILLDNWRFMGRLVWGPVAADPHYEWNENKVAALARLEARRVALAIAQARRAQPVRARSKSAAKKRKMLVRHAGVQGRSTPANAVR